MTTFPVDPRDARRLAAVKGIPFTEARRELAAVEPNQHLRIVRSAQELSLTELHWTLRAADDFASGLPQRHPQGALAAGGATTVPLLDSWYSSARAVYLEDAQHIDDYDGDELWNLTFTLEVEVTGLLASYRDPVSLSADGLKADEDYSPENPWVHVAARQVEVTVAGLRALDGDDTWEEQEILSAVWF